jgi:molybdopterin-containing oxidoreductase family membrane subunit
VLGCAGGFALTSWTASQWGLIVGGKPVVALVPFAVIAFELTILFGALATLLGMLVHARLPSFRVEPVHDPAFSTDRFGVLVRSAEDRKAAVESALRQAGAEEIRRVSPNEKPTTDN